MGTLDQFKELFYSDRLQSAYELLSSLSEEEKSAEEVQRLLHDFSEADRCLSLLMDLDSWNLVKEQNDIAVFSKFSQSEFIVRAQMLLDQEIFPVLALFSEVDLLSSWIDVVNTAEHISKPSNFRNLVYYRFDVPWPASDRDMVVCANGIPIPENDSVLIVLQGLNQDFYLGTEIPPPRQGDVRVDLTTGCINLMFNGEKTQVSLIIHSDPHVAMIPESLIEFATKHGIFYFFDAIRRKTLEFKGSIFEQRVAERPEYYNLVKSVLESTIEGSSQLKHRDLVYFLVER